MSGGIDVRLQRHDLPARLEVTQCQSFSLRLDLERPLVRILDDSLASLVDFGKHIGGSIARYFALLLCDSYTLKIDQLRLQRFRGLGVMSPLRQTKFALQDLFFPIIGWPCSHSLHS